MGFTLLIGSVNIAGSSGNRGACFSPTSPYKSLCSGYSCFIFVSRFTKHKRDMNGTRLHKRKFEPEVWSKSYEEDAIGVLTSLVTCLSSDNSALASQILAFREAYKRDRAEACRMMYHFSEIVAEEKRLSGYLAKNLPVFDEECDYEYMARLEEGLTQYMALCLRREEQLDVLRSRIEELHSELSLYYSDGNNT